MQKESVEFTYFEHSPTSLLIILGKCQTTRRFSYLGGADRNHFKTMYRYDPTRPSLSDFLSGLAVGLNSFDVIHNNKDMSETYCGAAKYNSKQ